MRQVGRGVDPSLFSKGSGQSSYNLTWTTGAEPDRSEECLLWPGEGRRAQHSSQSKAVWPDPDQNYLVITDHCFFPGCRAGTFSISSGCKKNISTFDRFGFCDFPKSFFCLKSFCLRLGIFQIIFFTFFGWNLTWNQSRPSNFGSIKIV